MDPLQTAGKRKIVNDENAATAFINPYGLADLVINDSGADQDRRTHYDAHLLTMEFLRFDDGFDPNAPPALDLINSEWPSTVPASLPSASESDQSNHADSIISHQHNIDSAAGLEQCHHFFSCAEYSDYASYNERFHKFEQELVTQSKLTSRFKHNNYLQHVNDGLYTANANEGIHSNEQLCNGGVAVSTTQYVDPNASANDHLVHTNGVNLQEFQSIHGLQLYYNDGGAGLSAIYNHCHEYLYGNHANQTPLVQMQRQVMHATRSSYNVSDATNSVAAANARGMQRQQCYKADALSYDDVGVPRKRCRLAGMQNVHDGINHDRSARASITNYTSQLRGLSETAARQCNTEQQALPHAVNKGSFGPAYNNYAAEGRALMDTQSFEDEGGIKGKIQYQPPPQITTSMEKVPDGGQIINDGAALAIQDQMIKKQLAVQPISSRWQPEKTNSGSRRRFKGEPHEISRLSGAAADAFSINAKSDAEAQYLQRQASCNNDNNEEKSRGKQNYTDGEAQHDAETDHPRLDAKLSTVQVQRHEFQEVLDRIARMPHEQFMSYFEIRDPALTFQRANPTSVEYQGREEQEKKEETMGSPLMGGDDKSFTLNLHQGVAVDDDD
ncbi:hypothetical protein L7F22_014601 [Adiantum nelumboides]|nr:hypothetical protein [Adiantum nelumboides]